MTPEEGKAWLLIAESHQKQLEQVLERVGITLDHGEGLMDVIPKMADEIKRLQAFVAELPEFQDGGYVTSPFQTVWRWSNHEKPRLMSTTLYSVGWFEGKQEAIYSTLEAADGSERSVHDQELTEKTEE